MNQCQDFTRFHIKKKEQLQKEDYFNGLFRIQDDDGDENVIREVDRVPNDERNEQMIAGEYTSHGGAHSANRNRDLPYGLYLF